MKFAKKIRISVWQLLALGYLSTTIIGSALLSVPAATQTGNTSYLDALFTATSATCVTGLAVFNTYTHWSLFGQSVILVLIQLGGLGFMTFVSAIFYALKKDIGLYGKKAFMTATGLDRKYFGLGKLVKRITLGTFIFEFIGAFVLCFRFVPQFGWANGIYFAVWHSVSAFCNAGFDLMGINGGASLGAYVRDPLVSLTICALILTGGLGFYVWSDIIDCKCNPKKFQLNTKFVLIAGAILVIAPTALFTVFEWNNPLYADFTFGEKLLASFFNAVTPRTAGFFTTSPDALSESGYALTLTLMFIGGNSGSTAGGIKVGTFALVVIGMISVFRKKRDINMGKKRLESTLLPQALAICTACITLVIVCATLMCAIQPNLTFKQILFECVSALSTVGLTLNATELLSAPCKIIIILLMYAGRVGILTLALAVGEKRTAAEIRYPTDSILIG